MKHQRIIVKLPTDLIADLDESAFAARLTREEMLLEICRRALVRGGDRRRVVWLAIAEAARRSGRHAGHLRKLCVQLQRDGLARKSRRGKGKAGWELREDADASFAPVPLRIEARSKD
jgi:hypothetical protein